MLILGSLSLACEAGGGERQDEHAATGARVYTSPSEIDLPFRTSVPDGIRVETAPSGSSDAVTFVGSSGEDRNDRAFLHFVVQPESTSEFAAREVVNAVAESYRIPGTRNELPTLPPPPWAVVSYTIRSQGTRGETVTGWVALGRHQGRWFHILVQQPQSLEERFTPQVEEILASWRWIDGGRPLER